MPCCRTKSRVHADSRRSPAIVDRLATLRHTPLRYLPYAQSLNLTACEGLAIDTSVPQGQRTGAELLVFLRTANGDRFLGNTGRYLNAPGPSRAYAMFSQFKPFEQTDTQCCSGCLARTHHLLTEPTSPIPHKPVPQGPFTVSGRRPLGTTAAEV